MSSLLILIKNSLWHIVLGGAVRHGIIYALVVPAFNETMAKPCWLWFF
jgi:hypothetical protein